MSRPSEGFSKMLTNIYEQIKSDQYSKEQQNVDLTLSQMSHLSSNFY